MLCVSASNAGAQEDSAMNLYEELLCSCKMVLSEVVSNEAYEDYRNVLVVVM